MSEREISFYVEGDFAFSIWDQGGWLTGYIAVPPSHPWYGEKCVGPRGEGGEVIDRIEVHGGVTYADSEGEGRTGVVYPHNTGLDLWWIGFDCAHYGDWTPMFPSGVKRDENFVREELRGMAAQAADAVRKVRKG